VTVVVVAVAIGALAMARGPLLLGLPGAGNEIASPTPTPAAATPPPATPSPPPTPPPATPSPPPTPPPATPAPRTYEVQPGDTLSGIAARFGTTVQELAELNGIANPSLIFPGQVLTLP
jgi:LysM repeat protein